MTTTTGLPRMGGLPRLAVVEVTGSRPDRPEYHAKVQVLNSRVAGEGALGGWQVTRTAAADAGVAELLALTADADAIVIVGGEDITPSFYGGLSGYEGETRHYDAADEGQIALVQRALVQGTPLLGICRGLQIINVALGGTLVQHIEDHDGIHRNAGVPIDQILTAHDVTLLAASGLAETFGQAGSAVRSGSSGQSGISVQSAHHQSVGVLGHGLVPAAVAPDGLVEAVEHTTAPITGVQWHPEAPDAPADQLRVLLGALGNQVAAIRFSGELVAA